MAFKGGVVLGTVSFNATGAGTTAIGATSNTGTISIGNTSSGAVAINCGTAGITVGATANAHSSIFGSTNSTSSTTVQSGSGALNITSTGGAQTHNSGTGALGISTDASATTISIGTGAAVKALTLGSTNTSSSTVIKSGSGNIVLNSGLTVDSTGRMTNAVQPAFLANSSAIQSNVTGDGTNYTVIFDTINFNQGSGYNNATGIFTAPVTGRYQFNTAIMFSGLSAAYGLLKISLQSTQYLQELYFINPGTTFSTVLSGFLQVNGSCLTAMNAGETAFIVAAVQNGTKTVNIYSGGAMNGSTPGFCIFSGYLVC